MVGTVFIYMDRFMGNGNDFTEFQEELKKIKIRNYEHSTKQITTACAKFPIFFAQKTAAPWAAVFKQEITA